MATLTSTAGTARVTRATTLSRVFAVVALGLVVLLATLPSWAGRGTVNRWVDLLVFISLAQMWNLLAGFAGVVSVGQQAFVGLGAYGMVILVNNNGVSIYWSIIIAAIGAAVISIPMGLVAFRLRGSYFAIGTWVLAEVVRLSMKNNNQVGGGSGVSLTVKGYKVATRTTHIYWFALAAGVGAVLLTYLLLRSRLGLQLQAIRDNESGARGLGANVYRTRFLLWVVVAFWTGLTGAIFYTKQGRIQPDQSFSVVAWTAPIIFMAVIGGLGTIEGPIIGAFAYWFFADRFSNNPAWYFMVLGVVIALFLKRGVWGSRGVLAGMVLFTTGAIVGTGFLEDHPTGYLFLAGGVAATITMLNTVAPQAVRRWFSLHRGVDLQLFPVRHKLRQ
jgi:branched-chain amino acid transport system permease protein